MHGILVAQPMIQGIGICQDLRIQQLVKAQDGVGCGAEASPRAVPATGWVAMEINRRRWLCA